MAKSSQQSQQPTSTRSATQDRVEALARDLFIRFAQLNSSRTPEWVACEAYKLAECFYRVADAGNREELFAPPAEPCSEPSEAAELEEASV